MHFWINKGSQGCGINGRCRYVPPYHLSTGTRRGGIHPKPMVTPVHRFQSIESVASGGRRHSRAPSYHTRFPAPPPSHLHNSHDGSEFHNNPIRNTTNPRIRRISIEPTPIGQTISSTPPNYISTSTTKIKCGVGAFISLVPFFIIAGVFYSNGSNMGIKSLTFCAIIIVILLVGGVVSLFQAITSKNGLDAIIAVQMSNMYPETEEDSSQVPTNISPIHAELPPPPYHIAVMLPTQDERLAIIRDSPPPTYEKAVT